jgi:glycine hydroxymethyltransferase
MYPSAGGRLVSGARTRMQEAVARHHSWRGRTLDLSAAETITSDLVRSLLASDFSRRYATRSGAYSGSRYVDEIERDCEAGLCRLFGCDLATALPATGNLALLAVLLALTEPGDVLVALDPQHGGYPVGIAARLGLSVHYLPVEEDELAVDGPLAGELVERLRPRLVLFGASSILFGAPLEELVAAAGACGATVCYDGSHPLGLIAGKAFQQPFEHGVDVLLGSTSKTFFGPQRGVVLVREREDLHDRIVRVLDSPPLLQSSHHAGSAVALAAAVAEFEAFGEAYARAVVANARALAHSLVAHGVPVEGSARGYTETHQVSLGGPGLELPSWRELRDRLERSDVLGDGTRLGTQQVTRLGMGPPEMERIAALIADVVLEARAEDEVRADANALAARFTRLHYSFDDGADAFARASFPAPPSSRSRS